jgi:RHS repeat-associated protein
MFSKKINRTFIGLSVIAGLVLSVAVAAWPCTPPSPPGPTPRPGCPCDNAGQGPAQCSAEAGGRFILQTGAVHESQTDLVVGSVGPQYRMTRAYSNRFDQNPSINYKGDLGWNWSSGALMLLSVAEPGTPYPAAIRITYETTLERVLHKSSDSPIKYSSAANVAGEEDIRDVVDETTVGGQTYWRLTKICGRKFYFYPFTAGRKAGRLAREEDAVGNALVYSYDSEDRPASVADMVGNTVTFTYYAAGDAREGLLQTVQWSFSSTVRQTVYYAYDDQQNLCRVTTEVADVQNSGQKIRRTTLYVYYKVPGDVHLEHNLLYIVAPEQYKAMQNANVQTLQSGTHYLKDENVLDGSVVYDPDTTSFPQGKSWPDYAYRRFQYGTNSANADYDRVNQEVLSSGEQVSYAYKTNPVVGDGLPSDLVGVATMMVTTTRADGFTEKGFTDALGRLRYRIQSDGTVTENPRYDLDSTGRMTAVTYSDGRKMRHIYMTGYNPDTDVASGTATEYPSFDVIEYTTNQQTVRRVLASYTYGVPTFPALPLTKTVYQVGDNNNLANGVEGTDKFTTDYAYSTDGKGLLIDQVQPKVNGLLPGQCNAKDYRLGAEYTYNTLGQVVYAKQFICDAYTPGNPLSFTNRIDQTQTRNVYYSSGASNGLVQYVIEDASFTTGDGRLNLKTEYQYDSWRNASNTIVDPDGLAMTTQYTYDPTGLLLTTTSSGGYYTANIYDSSGRLVETDRYKDSTKAVQLGKAQYVYDLYGRQSDAKQWFGSGTNDYVESYVTYDSRGRVDSRIDPPDGSGNRHGSQYIYDKWGHVTQTAVGGTWNGDSTGSWSAAPDVVSKTVFATNYYGEGLVDSTKDGYDDNVSANTYDARTRLSKVLRKKSDVNFGDSNGTLRTTLQVEYTYDNRGLVTMVQSKDTDGTLFNQTTSTLDGMGRLLQQSIGDGNGNSLTTSYDYDALGRVWRVTDPSGNYTITQYDTAGRQIQVTDGEGNLTTYAYNAAGQLTNTIREDHKPGAGTSDSDYLWYVVAYAYDSEGRISSVTDQGEDTNYDGVGEGKTGQNDYLVAQTHYYDDAFQASIVTTDPLSHHTKIIHDGLGRQTWLMEGGSGTLPNETYARQTRFDYDPAGRQIAIVSGGPDGIVGQGGDDQTTSYAYNSHGQVASVQYPDASPNTVSYTYYSNNDALATVTDQKSVVTTYTYKTVADGNNYRLEGRQYVSSGTPDGGDRDVITTANGLGQVVSVVTKDTAGGTQTSKVSRQYKFCGALWKEPQQIGDANGDSRTVEYGFDTCGKVNKLYWPHTGTAGDYVAFSDFDGLNRARTYSNNISGTGTTIATYTFLGARPATKEYPQGDSTHTIRQTFWSSSENNYDHYGRLASSHAVRNPTGTPADVMKVNYTYDDGSNPTWRYDELSNASPRTWGQKYEYDVMDRLVKAQQGVVGGTWPSSPSLTADKIWVWDGSQGGNTYTLDKVGNWAKFYNNGVDDQRTHNNVNEITGRTVGGTAKNPSWDNTGCLSDDGENYKYVYDFRNRLVQAKRRGDNSLLAAYSYDGLNRRIRKIVYDTDGTTELSDTRFLYDGWRCVEERNENDSHKLVARYIFGGLYIDEPLLMDRDTGGDGDVYGAGDTHVRYLQDRLFNVVGLTDASGSLVERTWYEPYGNPTNRREFDGDEAVASHLSNPLLFCAYRQDSETSLYHVRNRMYNPGIGSFMQRDPLGRSVHPASSRNLADSRFTQRDPTELYRDGVNLYQYVKSNPASAIDPEGTIVVVMAGYHEPSSWMDAIKDALEAQLKSRLSDLDASGAPYIQFARYGNFELRDQYDAVLRSEYNKFLIRKKNKCSLEAFIAVGHSSGASAIYNELWAGTFRETGGDSGPFLAPAFLGLIDMVLYKQPPELWHPDLTGRVGQILTIIHWKNWSTTAIRGIPNVNAGFFDNHFSILSNARVISDIALQGSVAYHARAYVASEALHLDKWETKNDGSDNHW